MSSPLLGAIDEVARDIDRRFRERGGESGAFAEVASQALAALGGATLSEVVGAFAAARALPPQYNVGSTRPDPKLSLVVFEGESFFVELVLWVDPQIVIHDHNFTGAYVTLFGEKLNALYEPFVARERIDEQLYLGDPLVRSDVEVLGPGDVRSIPTPGGVHRIFHLGAPTASVLAVHPLNELAYIFQEPGFARRFDWDHDDNHLGVRRQQVMHLLADRAPPELAAYARRVVLEGGVLESYQALVKLASLAHDDGLVEEVAAELRVRRGAWVDVVVQALRHEAPLRAVDWPRIEGREERLVIAGLLTYEDVAGFSAPTSARGCAGSSVRWSAAARSARAPSGS